ncbi:MAG: glutaredoxin family protein [Spirochaetaceae bacterium]|nr:MAG: glutaredoxin family protein [Spirochaetaceae bacterium]
MTDHEGGQEPLRYQDFDGRHNRHRVTVYGLQNCSPCRDARQFLATHDVAHRYVMVDWQLPRTRIEIKQRLEQAYGDRPIYPAIEIDNQLHFGFDGGRWAELLSLDSV